MRSAVLSPPDARDLCSYNEVAPDDVWDSLSFLTVSFRLRIMAGTAGRTVTGTRRSSTVGRFLKEFHDFKLFVLIFLDFYI